ncbi:MAG: hypothetical protein DPW13_06675 [Planctomycetes bacterium]|nr:hypothetical protein [Planctomycetota bacterium]
MRADDREQRELIRCLSSRQNQPWVLEKLKDHGLPIVKVMLDELQAAMLRIKNAPVGTSKGALSSALGPCRLENPKERTLLEAIPNAVAQLAREFGKTKTVALVRRFANESVRERVLKALAKSTSSQAKW